MWDKRCEESFQELKKKITTVPVLIMPNPSNSFVVYCHTPNIGLDGVLMQDVHVVAYASRQLKIH